MSRVADLHFRKIVRPLRTAFATSLGSKQQMISVLVTVTLDDGSSGTGEVPTSLAFAAEKVEIIARTLSEARTVKGIAIDDWRAWIAGFRSRFSDSRMTVAGLEVAFFRAHLRALGMDEYAYWGRATDRLETDITIPLSGDEVSIKKWIAAAVSRGFTTFKLKVGGDKTSDKRLLRLVYDALRAVAPGFCLRLDGNQAYDVSAFLDLLDHIDRNGYEIELFEQPLRADDFRGYEVIMRRRSVPIFLDESVRSTSDAARAIENGLCDGINIKIAKSGIVESEAILSLARRAGKSVMIGCMIESMVGLSAAVFFAAGKGMFGAIDLDSPHFLYGRNEYPGISLRGPIISIV